MKKLMLFAAALTFLLFFSNPVSADYITPDDLTLGTGLSWDHDEVKPEGSNVTGAPGFGASSFYSNVTGSATGGGIDYTALRIYANYFSSPITVGDITNISYWTNNTDDSLIDWAIKIYTVNADSGPGWYDTRINFNNPTGTTGVGWEEYDINSLGIAYTRNGETNVENHASGQTLSPFAIENVLFIDIVAGFSTSSPPVYSYLDGVELETSIGTYTLDLGTPVPEPTTMVLLGLGLLGLAGVSRRKSI